MGIGIFLSYKANMCNPKLLAKMQSTVPYDYLTWSSAVVSTFGCGNLFSPSSPNAWIQNDHLKPAPVSPGDLAPPPMLSLLQTHGLQLSKQDTYVSTRLLQGLKPMKHAIVGAAGSLATPNHPSSPCRVSGHHGGTDQTPKEAVKFFRNTMFLSM